MTFNNRIYFRDHPPPVHVDNAPFAVSGRVHATAITSLSFAGANPQSQASTGDSFKLDTISQTVDLEKQKGDAASTSSQPVCAFSHYSCNLIQRFGTDQFRYTTTFGMTFASSRDGLKSTVDA